LESSEKTFIPPHSHLLMKEVTLLWFITILLALFGIGILYYTDHPPVGRANVYASFTVLDQTELCEESKNQFMQGEFQPHQVYDACKALAECVDEESFTIVPYYRRWFLWWSWYDDNHCIKVLNA
jgi:hypothetical protein